MGRKQGRKLKEVLEESVLESWKFFEEAAHSANEIHKLLQKGHKTVACAESCTGGLIATLLTETPGSSRGYLGGISCYSNEAKIRLLSVPEPLIVSVGAVSKEVAGMLAENVRTVFQSSYGLGVTGIAGPEGGTKTKPVGTIWCSISGEGIERAWMLNLKGDRRSIRFLTAKSLLGEFLVLLRKDLR